mmetsp:Transcript_3707/g.4584  ORF Transcript_3707/g.4584 Transcript_3707/m.4584 type:complete len:89 (+) Transcript_3707:692-958(+)
MLRIDQKWETTTTVAIQWQGLFLERVLQVQLEQDLFAHTRFLSLLFTQQENQRKFMNAKNRNQSMRQGENKPNFSFYRESANCGFSLS